MVLIAVVASLVVGFVGGVLSLKAKNKWCAGCGTSLACLACGEVNSGAPRSCRDA
ncbi:nitrate/TMAO reductase-like tetraheme cytochrome c subunit [Actinoplanes campanulatus]|uniref:Nitrate/TMAO reductase-like tetraheme cytochrome c subunit n=1 Tax=Actinoplanes campanulatus TaxID=113559 RepID=A0A7W5AS03_9ACTN|nr:nitrate/TMAO reductase-like tetraheme cytochrome c subunit [Actinoplanes campanulatus]